MLRPVEIAWVLTGASQALMDMLGVSHVPLLTLSELQEGVMRVPWLAPLRSRDLPSLSVGLEGIDEEAVRIFLLEEREPRPGEPGAYRVPHLDEGGYRPGMRATLRPQGTLVGHAVAAAVAVALALETGGLVDDPAQAWVTADGGSTAHDPTDFVKALWAERRHPGITEGAAALWARRPRP